VNTGTTFITRMAGSGDGIRLAVKDLIDVAGVPTTAGSRALAATAAAAERDAPCLAGARAAGARIVGKANLNELAYGASGVNEYFGTPVNPLDPGRVPGGSSSGSAVAVADGEADLAFGSDTGGSIRVPAAFCGITGLKTTHGRIPLAGVWPLAPSMDTIGPMARDVAGVAAGLALLEPGFSVDVTAAARVGRIRPGRFVVDPVIDAAVDAALARCGVEVIDVELPGWDLAGRTSDVIIDAEAVISNRVLLADPARRDLLGPRVRASLAEAQAGQAVPSLVRSRRGLLAESVFRDVRPGPVRPGQVLSGQILAGRVRPGGVLRLGAGPLISRGRDYPGALRLGGVILFSQAPRSVRLLTGGPVRLVTGRNG